MEKERRVDKKDIINEEKENQMEAYKVILKNMLEIMKDKSKIKNHKD